MATRIYVGNLPYTADNEQLTQLLVNLAMSWTHQS